MTPAAVALLAELRAAGLHLEPSAGDKVHVRPLELLTPERRQAILSNKPALRAVLTLEQRIRSMADRWQYTDADLAEALEGAAADPAGWLAAVQDDEELTAKCLRACIRWPA